VKAERNYLRPFVLKIIIVFLVTIYVINITEDVGYYGDGLDNYENPGRQNGQNLAYKYVYPEIVNGDYELAVDVHSNIGAYDFKTFVFVH